MLDLIVLNIYSDSPVCAACSASARLFYFAQMRFANMSDSTQWTAFRYNLQATLPFRRIVPQESESNL
jgi:hypothetical protein